MNWSIAVGITGGIAAGTAIGLGVERATRQAPGPERPPGYDAWKDRFDTEFGPQQAADEARNEELSARHDAWLEANPPPEDTRADRYGASWSEFVPAGSGGRKSAAWVAGFGLPAALGGIVGTAVLAGQRGDARMFVGAKGALAWAMPSIGLAYMGGFIAGAIGD